MYMACVFSNVSKKKVHFYNEGAEKKSAHAKDHVPIS